MKSDESPINEEYQLGEKLDYQQILLREILRIQDAANNPRAFINHVRLLRTLLAPYLPEHLQMKDENEDSKINEYDLLIVLLKFMSEKGLLLSKLPHGKV
jgi:hypothetical protein